MRTSPGGGPSHSASSGTSSAAVAELIELEPLSAASRRSRSVRSSPSIPSSSACMRSIKCSSSVLFGGSWTLISTADDEERGARGRRGAGLPPTSPLARSSEGPTHSSASSIGVRGASESAASWASRSALHGQWRPRRRDARLRRARRTAQRGESPLEGRLGVVAGGRSERRRHAGRDRKRPSGRCGSSRQRCTGGLWRRPATVALAWACL